MPLGIALTAFRCRVQVERNGKLLSALLQQISSQTGGRSRKLDMGSAKAAAQHVNSAAVQGLLNQVQADLDLCKEFEVAYAKRLNLEQSLGARGPPAGPSVRPISTPHVRTVHTVGVSGRQVLIKHVAESALQQNKRRPAQKIPTIASTSNLLRGTTARKKYREAVLSESDKAAGLVNNITDRSGGHPSHGPGALTVTSAQGLTSHLDTDSQSGHALLNRREGASSEHDEGRPTLANGKCSPATVRTSPCAAAMPTHGNRQMGADEDAVLHQSSDQVAGDGRSRVSLRTVRSAHMDFSVPHADVMRALYKIDS